MERVSARAPRRRASVRLHLHAVPRKALRALALLLASALLNLTAAPAANAADASPGARAYAGEVTVVGEVRINGSLAASGETVFPGNVLATSEKSRSFVNLGTLGRVELSPRTSVSLDFGGAGTACALEGGRVRVYAPAESAASVRTADASVSSAAGATAVFSVESVGGRTNVVVQSGQAEVRAGGGVHRLSAGEAFTTAPEPEPRGMSDDKRKGLYVVIAGAVAVVLIVLAARDGGEDDQFSTCIDVISGESRCF
jgi:ferric-dicitrate binding protein FerR (iron transport regulator)